jgi:hypothetical protein
MLQIRPAPETALFINWFSPGMGCGEFRDDRAKGKEDCFIGMSTNCRDKLRGLAMKSNAAVTFRSGDVRWKNSNIEARRDAGEGAPKAFASRPAGLSNSKQIRITQTGNQPRITRMTRIEEGHL